MFLLIRGTILILALVVLFPFPAFAEEAPYRVIKVEKVPDPGDITKPPLTYYNINAGKEQGIKAGDFFKITRRIQERGDVQYSLFVGEVQVIESYENISKARLHQLADPAAYPIGHYHTVMLGDHAAPIEPPPEETVQAEAPAPAPPVETPPPPPPAPAAPEKVAEQWMEKVEIAEKVLFELNKAELRPEAKEVLRAVAGKVRDFDGKVVVEGHACDIGSEKYNLALSTKRAQAVVNYFATEEKIDKEKLEAKGFGEKVPVSPGKTEEERAPNRRVEIKFYEKIP